MNDNTKIRVPLCHMGGPGTTTIRHEGKDQCRRLQFAPAGIPVNTRRFIDLCHVFGVPVSPGDDGYSLLLAAAAEPHPSLARLPRVAAVVTGLAGESIPGITDDPRLQLHVLSRCAGRVFLRDLPPAIISERVNRPVTLLIPNSWSFDQ